MLNIKNFDIINIGNNLGQMRLYADKYQITVALHNIAIILTKKVTIFFFNRMLFKTQGKYAPSGKSKKLLFNIISFL